MGYALDPKKIKSAQRVLEVLEFFTADRQEATVMDITRSMGYPQSSTSELLSCLVALGYLHRDRYTRTYKPSARSALVGAWIQPSLFRRGALLPMMDDLALQSRLPVVLATKLGVEVQYIHTVRSDLTQDCIWRTGASGLLLHTAAGKALLADLESDMVRKLIHRLNAESPAELRVSFDALRDDLRRVRAHGYSVQYEEAGGGMVCVLLPGSTQEERLVLGIGGSSEAITGRREELVRLLRSAVSRHMGPVAVSSTPAPIAAPAPAMAAIEEPVRRFA